MADEFAPAPLIGDAGRSVWFLGFAGMTGILAFEQAT